MSNSTITKTSFTDNGFISKVNIEELRSAVNNLYTYMYNVDNCDNCSANTICQTVTCEYCQTCQGCQTCQTTTCQSCQSCQYCQTQSCQTKSCQSQCYNCGDCHGGTCFIAGTFVLMANYTWKKIEDVEVGEQVFGMTGVNTVQKLDRTILGNKRSIYTFKDNSLYFSGEHNMWVKKNNEEFFGVVDLTQHIREKDTDLFPELKGYTLNQDVILIDRPVEFAVLGGWKLDEPIIAREYGDDTELYCLILDGDHTMFTNGYAVAGFAHDDDFDYSTIHWNGYEI